MLLIPRDMKSLCVMFYLDQLPATATGALGKAFIGVPSAFSSDCIPLGRPNSLEMGGRPSRRCLEAVVKMEINAVLAFGMLAGEGRGGNLASHLTWRLPTFC